jgi:hypothetical protein
MSRPCAVQGPGCNFELTRVAIRTPVQPRMRYIDLGSLLPYSVTTHHTRSLGRSTLSAVIPASSRNDPDWPLAEICQACTTDILDRIRQWQMPAQQLLRSACPPPSVRRPRLLLEPLHHLTEHRLERPAYGEPQALYTSYADRFPGWQHPVD